MSNNNTHMDKMNTGEIKVKVKLKCNYKVLLMP